MKEKEMRFRVPASLYKKYKMICIELELSVPKQTAALIKSFVECREFDKDAIKATQKE